ncbi:DMSO reductase [Halostella sp. JP-L12]|uniref:ethylbenzene dehydrogenase-related protein n=1 Tax=Halostella TaxID=1843185 RepID=UPI000EF7E431|nr:MULTISPECIES: ethylbenzene dehydrogenase-related protein [Halostella]NHN47764.1 DMSO reductase [Halostella sp. JP-L12]
MSERSSAADGRRSLVAVAVALTLVTVAAVVPALVGARPANEVPVTELPDADDSLSEPTGDAWERTPAKEIALASAPSGAPNANDTSIESVSVRAAYTDERLFVRLSWDDPSRDGNVSPANATPQVNSFADAAAVQLPADAGANPGIAMGSDRTPVNVWYWSGATGGQELLAGGPGTTTPIGSVGSNASYEDGRWHVVYARNRTADAENRTSFDGDEDVRVAFAVWNGNNSERAGQKAVSEWQYLALGPGPEGPPYETILWAVAGLAIAAVVVATVVGVRRT